MSVAARLILTAGSGRCCWYAVAWLSRDCAGLLAASGSALPWLLGTVMPNRETGTMASADFCCCFSSHRWSDSQMSDSLARFAPWHSSRPPGISSALSPRPCQIYKRPVLGITGFTVTCQLTHRLSPYYLVSVRQVVAVAPASFGPHLTVTPLPSLNGPDSLGRRGLSPPRVRTCPAYKQKARPEQDGLDCLMGRYVCGLAKPVCGVRCPADR